MVNTSWEDDQAIAQSLMHSILNIHLWQTDVLGCLALRAGGRAPTRKPQNKTRNKQRKIQRQKQRQKQLQKFTASRCRFTTSI